MGKDLFQINSSNDIYFMLDLWAMLSPHLAGGGPRRTVIKKDESGEVEGDESSGVESGKSDISGD